MISFSYLLHGTVHVLLNGSISFSLFLEFVVIGISPATHSHRTKWLGNQPIVSYFNVLQIRFARTILERKSRDVKVEE